jgi:hypothetical protein
MTVTHDEDITDAVAPSIDLEQGFFNVVGLGIDRLRQELAVKKPLVHWLAGRAVAMVLPARRRAKVVQRLMERTRTAEAFRQYNRYLVVRLARQG